LATEGARASLRYGFEERQLDQGAFGNSYAARNRS
jgi:hypothetical protein